MDVLPGECRVRLPRGTRLFNPGRHYPAAIVPAWLLPRPEVNAMAKLLYGRLCGYCGRNDHCWPGLDSLAKQLGVSRSCIEQRMRELRKAGLIIAVSRQSQNRSSVYFFPVHPWMTEGPVAEYEQDPEQAPEGDLDGGGGDGGGGDGGGPGGDVVELHPVGEVGTSGHTDQPSSPGPTGTDRPGQATGFAPLSQTSPQGTGGGSSTDLTHARVLASHTPPKKARKNGTKTKVKRGVAVQSKPDDLTHDGVEPDTRPCVSLTHDGVYGSYSGNEIKERDQTSLSRSNLTGEPELPPDRVLALYDREYAAVHGRHYGPTKRDFSAASWAWEQATQVAITEAQEKGLGNKDIPSLRERVLRHWCAKLARMEGYTAQKQWAFWVVESVRTELGTPFVIEQKRPTIQTMPLDDGPPTPPEELAERWKGVMRAFQTGVVSG